MPTQNIYDTPAFFSAYASLPRQVDGLSSAPEWPALRRLLPPNLRGKAVLDLGCGFGWYSRWFTSPSSPSSPSEGGAGAASARGVDISERMLARAREMTPAGNSNSAVTFDRADLEEIQLPAGAYDLVFSALALHYVSDLRRLLCQVHASLRPGGALVFSVEHPLLTAPPSGKQGFVEDAGGTRYWPLDAYHDEGERVSSWLGSTVRKQHRTTATYVNLLLEAGFEITGFEDWHPERMEEFLESVCGRNWIRTSFLLLGAVKR